MDCTLFSFCCLINEAFFGAIFRGPSCVRAFVVDGLDKDISGVFLSKACLVVWLSRTYRFAVPEVGLLFFTRPWAMVSWCSGGFGRSGRSVLL